MSKRAIEKAYEKYPLSMERTAENLERNAKRLGYWIGYEQAEKDLGWHSVEESLPPIDEEVIALTNRMHGKELPYAGCICFAHRPNPEGWDGKDIFTGKVTHHDVVTYDGWNIPGVKYWMPCPKIPEE